MKYCPSCQQKYPDDAVVCGQCGARLMLDTSATMQNPQQTLIGRVLAGNYKVERLLGKGGMGAVFQARQLSLDRAVAIKVLLAPLAMEREMLERFQREAKAASNIGHPGIVQVIDMGYLEEGVPFMAMEMLEGEDLRSKINREGGLSLGESVSAMIQVCDALQAAHDKGIVHRDLKPENIFMIYRQGKVPLVKLLDFGLSKIKTADHKLTNTGALLGTPNYMSPEQVKGDVEVDSRADIYAAGTILYELLTGKSAYEGKSVQSILVSIMTEDPVPPRKVRPDLPEEVEAVIMKAMARDPDERFQTMNELAVELSRMGALLGVPSSQIAAISTPAPSTPRPAPASQQGAAVVTPTPPGVSVERIPSTPARRPSGLGTGLLVGLGVAGLLAFVVMVAVIAVAAIIFGLSRSRDEAEEAFEFSSLVEDEALFEDVEEEASPPAGGAVATGSHPYLCCGEKGCGMVYQQEKGERVHIHILRLGKDLEPKGDAVALTQPKETGLWPTCFARDDGGYLVFWQESRDPFDMSSVIKLHRLVVSKAGKPGDRKTTDIKNMIGIDEFEPSYAGAAAKDKVVVVWNHFHNVDSGIHYSVFDLHGKELEKDVIVHSKPTVFASMVACGEEKCIILWTRPSLPMNHIRKFSIVTTSGKVLERDVDVFDRGVYVSKTTILPVSDGVVVLWVENSDDGTAQMMAKYGWDGKEKIKPKRIDQFGNDFTSQEHPYYASASHDGSTFAVNHPRPDEELNYDRTVTLLFGKDGKPKSKSTFTHPDDDIYDSMVYYDTEGRPVIIYSVGMWGSEQDLYVTKFKAK